MAIRISEALEWLRKNEDGREWLETLPAVVVRQAEAWSLELGEPFESGYVSWVAPARTRSGEPVVLKMPFPHRESLHEGEALRVWDGDGAIRLLDHDESTHALLLERCSPGTLLRDEPVDRRLDVVASLLPRLWKPVAPPFHSLAAEAAHWSESLPHNWEAAGRPFERSLLEAGLAVYEELVPTQPEQVLLHQDLHAGNVLSATREPWLVIDPKPLVGERAFGLAGMVRDYTLGHSEREAIGRLDRMVEATGVDRERARRWALGQTLAWAFDGAKMEPHIDTARWLARA